MYSFDPRHESVTPSLTACKITNIRGIGLQCRRQLGFVICLLSEFLYLIIIIAHVVTLKNDLVENQAKLKVEFSQVRSQLEVV